MSASYYPTAVFDDNLCVSIWAIYFARWRLNGIDGGQHGVVSTALRHFETFHVLGVSYMIRKPTQNYSVSLGTKRLNVSKTFRCSIVITQQCSLFQIAVSLVALGTSLDRSMLSMEADAAFQGCLPSCKLHSRSLAVRRTRKIESSYVDTVDWKFLL